jgi:hypothetical protein
VFSLVNKFRAFGYLLWLFVMFLFSVSAYGGTPTDEDKLKAVLLYKLAKFVTWPANSGDVDKGVFRLCALRKSALSGALHGVEGKKIGKRFVDIHHLDHNELGKEICHLLFVSESEMVDLDGILLVLEGRPVLTVGDGKAFAESGGMVEIYKKKQRFSFRINLGTVKKSQLSIGSVLLDLSTVINGDGIE